ncbi:MAG TPA: hypothetical protein VFV52_09795 [Bacilli bacterium]|nr:hypothetical protein [Bacilli bacterium]
MTILGFVITILIVGVVMYAWYAWVHRDDANYATADEGGEATTSRRHANPRPRPTPQPALLAETGTIGELDDDPEGAPLLPAIRREAAAQNRQDTVDDPMLNTTSDEVERLAAGQDISVPPETTQAVNGVPGDVDNYRAIQSPHLLLTDPHDDNFMEETGTIGDITAAYNDTGAADINQAAQASVNQAAQASVGAAGQQTVAPQTATPQASAAAQPPVTQAHLQPAGLFPPASAAQLPQSQPTTAQPGSQMTTLSSAQYANLANQLPLVDDTVSYEEPEEE